MEETAPIREAVQAAGLELTLLATPTTPEPRMRAIAELSQGFVYLVSVAGALLIITSLSFLAKMRCSQGCTAAYHVARTATALHAACYDRA